MTHDETHGASARMGQRHQQLLDLCARAHGVGDYAGCDPDDEAAAEMEALLGAPISDDERADLEAVGWKPNWRKNAVGFARMMLGMAEDGDFKVSVGPGLAAVDPNADPQTRH